MNAPHDRRYVAVHRDCGHPIAMHIDRDQLATITDGLAARAGHALRIRVATRADLAALDQQERCEKCTTALGLTGGAVMLRPVVQRAANQAGRLHPHA